VSGGQGLPAGADGRERIIGSRSSGYVEPYRYVPECEAAKCVPCVRKRRPDTGASGVGTGIA